KKHLNAFRNTPFHNNNEVEQLFTNFNQLKEVDRVLTQSRFSNVENALRNLYKGEQTNVEEISQIATWVQQLNHLTNTWERNALDRWIQILQEKNIRYSDEVKENNLN